ncbi:hypothetical protein SprV_0602130100 [Sparganum proliferum]
MPLRWSGHVVRMDDERLPKRLFYGDVATGSRRQGGQIRQYKDTLKSSLESLQINPINWEELALDRSTWRRTVKTSAAIYKANRIAAAKVKREARKSQAAVSHITNPDTTTDTTPTTSDSSDEDQDYTCPHCDRTFTSRIGLVDHLQIHRTETGEPVPGAPTYTHQTRLNCPHCPRTFTHHMRLFDHMRIHESGIDRSTNPPAMPNPNPLPHPASPPPFPQVTPTSPASPAHTAHAHSPHESAWSVTCESIAQRLANQCLEHQTTPTTLVSTAHTVLALSCIALAYSATCASTTTCCRQPPDASHHHTIPPCFPTTQPPITTHPPQAPTCHLPCKWEVCISTRSPCGSGCTGDLSVRLSRHVKRRG